MSNPLETIKAGIGKANTAITNKVQTVAEKVGKKVDEVGGTPFVQALSKKKLGTPADPTKDIYGGK